MNRLFLPVTAAAILFLATSVAIAVAPGPKVSENMNKHNLSSGYWNSGTYTQNSRDASITYKAVYDETNNPKGSQICIFCHTPHNAQSDSPLWNRKYSSQTFERYSSATLQIRGIAAAQYGAGVQPDGASKLCLSCHDGNSASGYGLGDVLRGGPISMSGGNSYITGIAKFDGTKMKKGHHPVSFVYDATVRSNLVSGGPFTAPTLGEVKLDRNSKMQCTTCHNPHQNQSHDDTNACYDSAFSPVNCDSTNRRKIVPFWVYHTGSNTASQDHDAVCLTCHPITSPYNQAPWPYP